MQRESIYRKKQKVDYPQRLSMITDSIDRVNVNRFTLDNNNVVLRGSQLRNT